ncbi:ferrichrome ABC transporter substrate-binding protein [Alkalicoccus urumqiensis]|uniref:Ferrichrome ABC transporter substrate-binding protein n=2 Tax=Alkalicoccus urumqiensis TaxID=1548213 RepID=A0A2P6MII3_ALKUR|nr:ferrichrome ABC transporter substrate-binding protein [Alkalicoccus urumqiensis]
MNEENTGGNENADEDGGEEEPSENNTSDENEASSDGITISHALGETELEEEPETIVALEWTYVEDLLALGVQPAGVADIEGYNQWVNIEEELSGDAVDVGTRQEPSLEEIARLEPDLIITASFRHEAIADSLEEIAPTVMFNPYPEEGEGGQYEEMETTFNEIASAVGREDEAETVLSDLEDTYAEAEEALSGVEAAENEFVVSQAFSANEQATLRLFNDNSMLMSILDRIGISNAFEEDEFQVYGYTETSVEALEPYGDANFMHIVQEDDNVFENQLAGNPVWEGLDFVENDRVYALPGDTWTFGGPLSAEVIADEVVNALTEEE